MKIMEKQVEINAVISKNFKNGYENGISPLETEKMEDAISVKKECIEDVNSVTYLKKETDTFVLDKEYYYREIKGEYTELGNVKNEESADNYYIRNCVTNYDDFQLTNEEISVKPELNGSDSSELRIPFIQYTMQEKNNDPMECFSKSRKRRQHANEYYCTRCEFKTKFKRSLDKHSLKHDIQTEIYKCPECNYTTKYKHNIKYHHLIHLDQSQVEMYQCEKCEYKTKRRGHLNSHMRVHLENAPMHYCDKCDYKTKHPGCLKKHITSHLKLNEANTVYQCTYCEHKTKNKTRLRKHEQRHFKPQKCGEFKCFHCNYQANNKYIFIKHLTTHRQQKIKCEYCSYETVEPDKLEGHKKIHINVK